MFCRIFLAIVTIFLVAGCSDNLYENESIQLQRAELDIVLKQNGLQQIAYHTAAEILGVSEAEKMNIHSMSAGEASSINFKLLQAQPYINLKNKADSCGSNCAFDAKEYKDWLSASMKKCDTKKGDEQYLCEVLTIAKSKLNT
ncbi:MAG: hypothetical protein C9356_20350 [Oleiphilus sp.]|nr:MAG: hypothetical protein C9356_20350 [Oleiphilus sp.]